MCCKASCSLQSSLSMQIMAHYYLIKNKGSHVIRKCNVWIVELMMHSIFVMWKPPNYFHSVLKALWTLLGAISIGCGLVKNLKWALCHILWEGKNGKYLIHTLKYVVWQPKLLLKCEPQWPLKNCAAQLCTQTTVCPRERGEEKIGRRKN